MSLVKQVLVVDSEPHIHRLVALLLGDNYQVNGCVSSTGAFEKAHETPHDVALVAEKLRDGDGLALLQKLGKSVPDLAVVMITAGSSVNAAVEAMAHGAFHYMRKTFTANELRTTVERAARHGSMAREVRRLRSEVELARGLDGMVGDSVSMRQLMTLTERVAQSDATALIVGESGTGKELLARTIHRIGPRAEKPFVAFDCSALSPSLLEAELFGHEKGAFTGARKARRGLFREAHGGTIFLDEIGDIAPAVQNKLLRVLQEREIKPVGGDRVVKIDVRVVAATNKDLKALVAREEFREDLYWRLAVVPLQVPPLRERKDDLPALSMHILAKRRGAAKSFAGDETRYPEKLSAGALELLRGYHWPGNIRELENILSRAAILCDENEIRTTHLRRSGLGAGKAARSAKETELPAPVVDAADGRPLKIAVQEAVKELERRAIISALEIAGGSPAKAARRLGISRASIYNKMRDYRIQNQ